MIKIDKRTKAYKDICNKINSQIEKAIKDVDLPNTRFITIAFAKLWLEDLQANPLEVAKILKKQVKKETKRVYK